MTSVRARMVHDADRVAWYVGRSALLPCGVGHGRHATWRSPSCTRLQGASMMRRSWNMGDKKTWSLGAQQGRYGGVSRGSSASHFTGSTADVAWRRLRYAMMSVGDDSARASWRAGMRAVESSTTGWGMGEAAVYCRSATTANLLRHCSLGGLWTCTVGLLP